MRTAAALARRARRMFRAARLCCVLVSAAAGWRVPLSETRPLFWVHTPKTGAVFRKHLIRVACPRVRRLHSSKPRRSDAFAGGDAAAGAEWRQPRCSYNVDFDALYGHLPFPRAAGALLVVLSREPSRRAVSSFHAESRGAGAANASAALLAHARRSEDCAIKMVLGFGCRARAAAARLDVAAAAARLEGSAFLGVTDRWTDTLILLRRTFTLEKAVAPKRDASAQRAPRAYDDEDLRRGLAALAGWRTRDHELHAAAAAIFERRLRRSDDEELEEVLGLPG